jgi:quercetin dioxygenase-like cupin family protein
MPFHRFEEFTAKRLSPHLAAGTAPIIEGRYLYFGLITQLPGVGSELHYHPNELLIFALEGKINAVVGKDRRIVRPGTFIHVPAYARHSMKATEDGPVAYLYIKDKTWTEVGIAADEAPPEKALTVDEVNLIHESGQPTEQKKEPEKSQAIVEGLDECYYTILDPLDAPASSGNRVNWIEGERVAFGFFEYPAGYRRPVTRHKHEDFMYMLDGEIDIRVDNDRKVIGPNDIVEVPLGAESELTVEDTGRARYVVVRSMPYLESVIESAD